MRRRSPLTALTLALAFALAIPGAAGCDGDTDGDPTGTRDADVTDGDVVETDPWAAPEEMDAWRAMFSYRGRQGTPVAGENELWMTDPEGVDPIQITTLKDENGADLSCNFGCIPSPDLDWIVVADGPPTSTGFTLKLGRFNPDLEVAILKGGTIEDVIDFAFAGDRMYYSKQKSCTGATCQYEFFVVELQENVNLPTAFLTFPPDDQLADSTYKGHFRVSRDGEHMVMLLTTIRSVAVWLWKDGTGLVQLDFICKSGAQGDCSGTGSEYSDTDPVAIDPQGRWIAFFTFSDRWQRARLYDLSDPDDVQLSILATVNAGNYITDVCEPGNLLPWQWERVIGDPTFTPDGEEIVFLTETTCDVEGVNAAKPRTNLRRIKAATLAEGRTVTEDDVFNITEHPFGDVTANRRITAFDLSPDGATAVFTATPRFGQNDQAIPDGTSRQRNDRELFRVRIDGTNDQQLTNELTLSAQSPLIVPWSGQ